MLRAAIAASEKASSTAACTMGERERGGGGEMNREERERGKERGVSQLAREKRDREIER